MSFVCFYIVLNSVVLSGKKLTDDLISTVKWDLFFFLHQASLDGYSHKQEVKLPFYRYSISSCHHFFRLLNIMNEKNGISE